MRQLEPQLSELLRTCIHPLSLFLQVKHIKRVDLKYDSDEDRECHIVRQDFDGLHRYAAKLLLGDGELMIQALLHRKISTLPDVADLEVGDFVDCRRFTLRKSSRLNGKGKVVYLAIEDCTFIKVPKVEDEEPMAATTPQLSAGKRRREQTDSFSFDTFSDYESAAEEMLQQSPTKKAKRIKFAEDAVNRTRGQVTPSKRRSTLPPSWIKPVPEEDEEEEFAFSTQESNPATRSQRRLVLRELDRNIVNVSRPQLEQANKDIELLDEPEKVSQDPALQTPFKIPDQVNEDNWMPTPLPKTDDKRDHAHWVYPKHPEGAFALSQIQPSARPRFASPARPRAKTQPEKDKQVQAPAHQQAYPPPPFHTLRSLRNPPADQPLPAKSYTFSTLAVITWTGTSLIHRQGSVFPPKRHLQLIDSSFATTQPPASAREIPSPPASSSTFRPETPFQEAVTIAIYIDADTFKPPAGTIALFRGLVMQRLANGDIILNAYGRLKEMVFQGDEQTSRTAEHSIDTHWFITDPDRIRGLGYGLQLSGLEKWWRETKKDEQKEKKEKTQKM